MACEIRFRANGAALAARLRARGVAVRAASAGAQRDWAEKVLANARALSRGTLKTAQLRQYVPGLYSRKRPAAADDSVINMQSGRLAASWVIREVDIGGNRFELIVTNTSPEYKFMVGTNRMRERPILDKAIRMAAIGVTEGPAPFILPAIRATEKI